MDYKELRPVPFMNAVVRRMVFSFAFILLGAYGYFALSGPQGLPALREKRQEIRRLEEENANLASENELKRDRIRKLEENVSEQDLEIRKKLKKLRQDETEFILPDGGKGNSTVPDATH